MLKWKIDRKETNFGCDEKHALCRETIKSLGVTLRFTLQNNHHPHQSLVLTFSGRVRCFACSPRREREGKWKSSDERKYVNCNCQLIFVFYVIFLVFNFYSSVFLIHSRYIIEKNSRYLFSSHLRFYLFINYSSINVIHRQTGIFIVTYLRSNEFNPFAINGRASLFVCKLFIFRNMKHFAADWFKEFLEIATTWDCIEVFTITFLMVSYDHVSVSVADSNIFMTWNWSSNAFRNVLRLASAI